MRARIVSAVVLSALALTLVACSPPPPSPSEPTPPPGQAEPDTGGAAGMRLAPGFYELEDGTAQALGTLEYRDVEGGFWAVIGGLESEGTAGQVAAVIANPDEFESQLESLKGKQVLVTGTKAEGASIRMSGPEIVAEKIEELTDTPGIAE